MAHKGVTFRRSLGVILAALLVLSFGATVSAHEHRQVGDFEFVVGFMNEPAYVNELNGIDLRITRVDGEEHGDHDDHDEEENGHGHNGGAPVENAHETLRAVIIYGDETMEVDLRPVWGQPGSYTADVIPTETGTYSFQFIGEIDGQEINETFRGGPDTFSEVEDRDAIAFPANAQQGVDETDQAFALGIAGVVAGLLGLIAGAAAYFKVSKTPSQERAARQQASQQASHQQPSE